MYVCVPTCKTDWEYGNDMVTALCVMYDILSGVINGRYVVHSNTHVQIKIQVARDTVQFGCDYVAIYVDNLIGHNLPSV